jgi:RNA polymerase sigma-70 factor (ECF subfamily)
MRLMVMLTDHPLTCTPSGYALLSLMCFHASRFEARTNQDGEIILYEDRILHSGIRTDRSRR